MSTFPFVPVAALFVRRDSIYKQLGVDCWDDVRDARRYDGPYPVVAHPPCAQWGSLRGMAKKDAELKACAESAVAFVRAYGGVLEHPARSTLWEHCDLPLPGQTTGNREFTIAIPQLWFGHACEKKTWIFVSGLKPSELPAVPLSMAEATHFVATTKRVGNTKKEASKRIREATPVLFAAWLIEAARRTAL